MKRSELIAFIALSLFLFLPNIMGFVMAIDLINIQQRITYIIGAILFYLLGLYLLKRRTFFYIASVSFLFAGVEIVHLVVNKATTSILFVYTCLISEKGEFLELLSSYWFVIVAFFALWGIYFYCVRRFISNEYTFPLYGRHGRIAAAITLPITIAIFLTLPELRECVLKVSPINICYRLIQINNINKDIIESENNLQNFNFGLSAKTDNKQDIIVFLIGETSRYDHWQLNGYNRATSPYLCKRDSLAELVSFDSCYSVANLTTVSVPLMLSRATPQNKRIYLQEQSIVDIFNESGYYTSWIADQSFTNRFLLNISAHCNYTEYIHDDKSHSTFVDTVLLAPLRKVLYYSAAHKMIILHSLGCHYKYSARYPESFRVYTPDKDGINTSRKEVMINSYDNAILFTDYFINRVINELEQTNKNTILVYVGDHGENLLDDERKMFLHGTYSGSIYEYHVPLFVWASNSWREAHPDKYEALLLNKHKKLSTMNIFHSLIDIADIPYFEPERSIVNPKMISLPYIYGLDANLQPFIIQDN